jgi:methyl-accepting chemotaxis protein
MARQRRGFDVRILSREQAGTAGLRSRLQSLKFALLFVTGCIATILVAELTVDGVETWRNFKRVHGLRNADGAGNRLVNGIYFLLRERPSVSAAFRANGPVPADLRQRIDEHRKAADENLQASLPALIEMDFPAKQQTIDTFQKARSQAATARARADVVVAQPRADRDPEAAKQYDKAMAALIDAAEDLWTAEISVASQSDAVLTRYSRIKRLSYRLREVAGLERSVIAATLVNGRRISPVEMREIENYRAQIHFGWGLVAEIAKYEPGASRIHAAISETEQQYFRTFRTLVDRVAALSAAGSAYDGSLNDWIIRTNPQIDSFLGILRAAAITGEERAAQLEAEAFNDLIFRILGVIAAIGAATACAFVVIRRVTNPLARVSRAVRSLASGTLEIEVVDAHRQDEIGEVARAVDFFKANLIETRNMSAAKDAERTAKERHAAAIETLARAFEGKVAGVVRSLEMSSTELETTSRSLSVSADQTNQQSASVAATAHQTTANVQTVATATDELARAAQQIGDQVTESARITGEAVDYARNANTTIQALAAGAEQIGEVVRLISEVAEQTNLLALNATIEAARAGDAGRGFAVVASEVKLLAGQTARATEQINSQIQHIQGATKDTVNAIKNIDGTIQEVNRIAVAVAAAVEEQHAATQEIARNIAETASGTDDVNRHIVEVQQATMHTGNAANQFLASASEVARSSADLRREVETFLSAVREAS